MPELDARAQLIADQRPRNVGGNGHGRFLELVLRIVHQVEYRPGHNAQESDLHTHHHRQFQILHRHLGRGVPFQIHRESVGGIHQLRLNVQNRQIEPGQKAQLVSEILIGVRDSQIGARRRIEPLRLQTGAHAEDDRPLGGQAAGRAAEHDGCRRPRCPSFCFHTHNSRYV